MNDMTEGRNIEKVLLFPPNWSSWHQQSSFLILHFKDWSANVFIFSSCVQQSCFQFSSYMWWCVIVVLRYWDDETDYFLVDTSHIRANSSTNSWLFLGFLWERAFVPQHMRWFFMRSILAVRRSPIAELSCCPISPQASFCSIIFVTFSSVPWDFLIARRSFFRRSGLEWIIKIYVKKKGGITVRSSNMVRYGIVLERWKRDFFEESFFKRSCYYTYTPRRGIIETKNGKQGVVNSLF